MRQSLVASALLMLASMTTLRADEIAEPMGVIQQLPATYPDHWMMVHDISFFHMSEGEILVVDPLATTQPSQYKGMLTASFMAAYQRSRIRGEHYVVETFTARGTRGGERTDVVTIYDNTGLKVQGEIVIPAKRLNGMPKPIATGLSADERLLMVYNFTPAQSVSIVDLVERTFVAEVPTPGCGFVVPTGERSFFSICSNGSLRTTHLDRHGKPVSSEQTDKVFDADVDPIFEAHGLSGGVVYFPTFQGRVLPVNVASESPVPGESWWLTEPTERSWRPAGVRPVIADADGVGYFLMQPDGAEGTHKKGGSEVWVFDLKKHQRTARLVLKNWGLTLGASGGESGRGENRLLAITNDQMKVDIYRLPAGEFVQTLGIEAEMPLVVHGAN